MTTGIFVKRRGMSAFGTSRTSGDVRLESARCAEADLIRSLSLFAIFSADALVGSSKSRATNSPTMNGLPSDRCGRTSCAAPPNDRGVESPWNCVADAVTYWLDKRLYFNNFFESRSPKGAFRMRSRCGASAVPARGLANRSRAALGHRSARMTTGLRGAR